MSESGYNATRFLSMVVERGGLKTTRYLLHAATVSEGYTTLRERNRLDLTVEAMILRPEWQTLFSDIQRRIAVKDVDRLRLAPTEVVKGASGYRPGAVPPIGHR